MKWLWQHSFLYYFINYIKYIILCAKDKNQYGNMLHGGLFLMLVKQYLRVELKKDWIGRMYGVINPNVDIDGNFDPSTMIIEIDGENTNNNEYVKTWIYKQLRLISAVFSLKEFYEKITIDIYHVGPQEYDNYLIVFDFESRQNKAYWRKKFLLRTLFLLLIASAVVVTLIFI